MIYSSLLFIYIFLPVSLLLYYITPTKHREHTLMLLSTAFCASFGAYYLLFIALYTAVNFFLCRLIEFVRKKRALGVIVFTLACIADLAVLFMFRLDKLSGILELLNVPKTFFPVGISFISLSAIGTLADVYFGRIKAERNAVSFALYFIFFPRLIMGPLLRYSSFSKMLGKRKESFSEMGVGFMIFIKGFAKKVMLADSLYMLVIASTSNDVEKISALTAWLGASAYILCFYFTLSGISDMGTGIGYLFGFKFPQSFNYPLFSSKLRHFASRWHMQVVQWFRRYLTRPLALISKNKLYRIIVGIAVWGLLGFWYSFRITGIIWGIILGVTIMIENRFGKEKGFILTEIFMTFIITIISTVFLMGDSVSYSMKYLLAMIGGNKLIADQFSLYLLKSYIVILIISIYASTNMFRSLMLRSGRMKVQKAINLLSPFVLTALMILCTILISNRGSSDMILMRL